MELKDFVSRDWNTLTDEEKRRAVLLIWGWKTEEKAFEHFTSSYSTLRAPDGSAYASVIGGVASNEQVEKHLWVQSPDPLTDPGAAMEVFKAKAHEYELYLCSGNKEEGFYWCSWHDTESYGHHIYAPTPELAICEACFRAWQARQEGGTA